MKRKIAAALSIVMIGASYASPFVQASDGTTSGSGSLNYVDKSFVKVVVPTSAKLDFVIDPQGLVALDSATGGKLDSDADELKAASGRILGTSALIFANKSIKDIKVSTTFKLADGFVDGNLAASNATTYKDTNSTKLNLAFLAVPSKEAIKLAYADGEGTKDNSGSLASINAFSINNFKGAANGALISKSGVTVDTVLEAPAYSLIKTNDGYSYELDTSKDNSAAGFVISGFCNPLGNFKNYTVPTGAISAEYTFSAAGSSDTVGTAATTGYGVTTTSATNAVKVTAPTQVIKETAPTAASVPTSVTQAADGTATITLTQGADKTVKLDKNEEVRWSVGSNGGDLMTETGQYASSFSSDELSLVIPKPTVDYLFGLGGTVTVTVKDTEGKSYNVTIIAQS